MKILDVPKSGSVAGQTNSRNRYGQYIRSRAVPVNPSSARQVAVRDQFTTLSQRYRTLTSAQRAGWSTLGASISRTDSLGQAYSLNAETCFVSTNMNRLAAGDAIVDDAPAITSVTALTTATLTTTGGTLSLAYTATPLSAGVKAFVYASPQQSAGVAFCKDLRLLSVTAAAAASPANILAAYTARFGVPVIGNKIFFLVELYNAGVKSAPVPGSVVVSA